MCILPYGRYFWKSTFHRSVGSCPAAMDELGYLKGGLEMKKDRVREKDEAKTKVLIKAQSLIFSTAYIKGKTIKPMPKTVMMGINSTAVKLIGFHFLPTH